MTIFDNVLKIGQSLLPVASNAWEDAGSATAESVRLAKAFGGVISDQLVAMAAPRNALTSLKGNRDASSDWAILSQFGEDVGKHIGATAGEAWSTLLNGGSALGTVLQDKGYKFEYTEEDLKGFGEKFKSWIREHPTEAATLLACLAAAPVAVTVTPIMLGLVGFTPLGLAAGSVAAGIQSAIGPVAAGSAFAILQSAAMGGYGVFIVNTVAATGAAGGTCSIAAASFVRVMKEDEQKNPKSEI